MTFTYTVIIKVIQRRKNERMNETKTITMAKTHTSTQDELLEMMKQLKTEVEEMESKHGKRIKELEMKHDKRIDELETKHEKRIEELETKHDKRITKQGEDIRILKEKTRSFELGVTLRVAGRSL